MIAKKIGRTPVFEAALESLELSSTRFSTRRVEITPGVFKRISVERAYWEALERSAKASQTTVGSLCGTAVKQYSTIGVNDAVRAYVLATLKFS